MYEFHLNSPFLACFSFLNLSTSNENAFVLFFSKPKGLQTIKLFWRILLHFYHFHKKAHSNTIDVQ